jgi:hypothetical protein
VWNVKFRCGVRCGMWNFKDSHPVTEEPFQVLAVWVESCIFSGQPVSRCLLYDQIRLFSFFNLSRITIKSPLLLSLKKTPYYVFSSHFMPVNVQLFTYMVRSIDELVIRKHTNRKNVDYSLWFIQYVSLLYMASPAKFLSWVRSVSLLKICQFIIYVQSRTNLKSHLFLPLEKSAFGGERIDGLAWTCDRISWIYRLIKKYAVGVLYFFEFHVRTPEKRKSCIQHNKY